MNALRNLSIILMILPAGTLLYDLANEWFINARFKLRSLQEWWSAFDKESLNAVRPAFSKFFSPKLADQFFSAPACLSLAILPVALYLIYRIWFKVSGGQGGSGYKFKSRF